MEDFLLQLYGVYEYDIDLEMNDIEINYIYNLSLIHISEPTRPY